MKINMHTCDVERDKTCCYYGHPGPAIFIQRFGVHLCGVCRATYLRAKAEAT